MNDAYVYFCGNVKEIRTTAVVSTGRGGETEVVVQETFFSLDGFAEEG